MLNYVKAELYKSTRRLYPYLFLAVIMGLEALILGFMRFETLGDVALHINFTDLVNILLPVLSMGLYFTFIVGDIVFSEQYKHSTLKNEISFGIPRTRVYLGKLITEAIVGLVLLALMVGFYLLLSAVLFPKDAESITALKVLGTALLAAVPLYVGALGLIHCCFSHLKSSVVAGVLPAAFLAMTGSVMGTAMNLPLGLFSDISRVVYPFLLTTPFSQLSPDINGAFVLNAWCIGVGWLVVTTALGIILFRKKEIS